MVENNTHTMEEIVNIAKSLKRKNKQYQSPNNIGECLYASDELLQLLEDQGIACGICFGSLRGNGHCWNEVSGNNEDEPYVIDITADQFEFCNEEVVCIPWSKMEEYGYEYESF